MTLKEALKILDSLADGYHPNTGDPLPDNSVCNSRSVIRALQMSIDFIKNHENNSNSTQKTNTTRKSKKLNSLTQTFQLQCQILLVLLVEQIIWSF